MWCSNARPLGCGTTLLLAKAVAKESRANFINVKGSELLNQVRAVVYSSSVVADHSVSVCWRMRTSCGTSISQTRTSPCVMFFDELDALLP